MAGLLGDWLSLLLRWAHIVAAIGWIGSSFYFMWLDASLKRRAGMDTGVKGENWTVHGGGFYHTQKYMVAPDAMPDDLHWFKWESYSTWLSGFALLAVTYYWHASSLLIDPAVADLVPWQAVLLSMISLAAGWVLYDWLCDSRLRDRPVAVFAILFAALVLMSWGFAQVFSARAAFLHVGAVIATIMSANVFLVIIPNQKIVVADLKAGRTPDPVYGQIAKLRSTHNNYLTLPVIFMMISNHYPFTYGHPYAPVIVAGVLVLGVVVRNWFNLYEGGAQGLAIRWQWPLAAALVAGLALFSAWRPDRVALAAEVGGAEALGIAQAHCVACHAARPTAEGFTEAPAGVTLETIADLRRHAAQVRLQAILSDAMPLGNPTGMTPDERARLGAWIDAGMPD
ncbi:urate hydroxylase PuuD [Limibaculum sp. M0105]|uniref:Urate hydroxylase PuuD n=1 Tax=Thermohalobaculum xanthum TaxID=2753746 RepID=A0A8J7M5T7_9RHOB|nr:urate hydroxylase PuuD [Thermohalobaculum xanthum]MBK0398766.1 urate hydroxylase PuuD [Thermohalobaculum xanthum]